MKKLIDKRELANAMGVTPRVVEHWASRLKMPRQGIKGTTHLYDLDQAITWRKANVRGYHGKSDDEIEIARKMAMATLRYKEAQALSKELGVDNQLSRLVSADDALDLFKAEIKRIKAHFAPLPGTIAEQVYRVESQKRCQTIIENAIKDALAALSCQYRGMV